MNTTFLSEATGQASRVLSTCSQTSITSILTSLQSGPLVSPFLVVAVCPESVYEISYISSGWCKDSLMRLALRASVGGASEDSVMAPSNCRAGCGTLSVPLTTMGQMLAYSNSWLSTASCEENVLTMALRDASQKLRCASGRRTCLLAS